MAHTETITPTAGPTSVAASPMVATIASNIEEKITAGLAPSYLEVINESGNHNVPDGSESHFKLIIVSPKFEDQRTLHRHRMVYAILEQELAGSVHALALHTYTDEQWREVENAPDSPSCRGGAKVAVQQASDM